MEAFCRADSARIEEERKEEEEYKAPPELILEFFSRVFPNMSHELVEHLGYSAPCLKLRTHYFRNLHESLEH